MQYKPEPLVKLVGITKRFADVAANSDVTLAVFPGEVLALLGENGAGKTTLMRVLTGLLHHDAGQIEVRGRRVTIGSPRAAWKLGIGMVHQHFMLVPNMTVAENVALGLRPRRRPFLELQRIGEELQALANRYHLAVDPRAMIEDLSVGEQQRVEILKLLYRGAEVLVFDEPTAVLSPPEFDHLRAALRRLAGEGKAIIFIGHKLDEVLQIADRCAVLRSGKLVGVCAAADTSKAELARMMIGRELPTPPQRKEAPPGREVLRIEVLSVVDPNASRRRLSEVSLLLREGEVLGIAGVEGNGQRELVQVLIGLVHPSAGRVYLGGELVDRMTPTEFRRRGGAIVPEDRHQEGVVLDASLEENLVMSKIARFSRRGFLPMGPVAAHSQNIVSDYAIKTPSTHIVMRHLSGGNQQKAVLARELEGGPRLLLAVQPTRGLDIAAAEMVHRQILQHRAAGGAILLISAELDEIFALSDRIGVMSDGTISRVMSAEDTSLETIGLMMAGERA